MKHLKAMMAVTAFALVTGTAAYAADDQVGRYQLFSAVNGAQWPTPQNSMTQAQNVRYYTTLKIDTVTGQVWQLMAGNKWEPIQ